MLLNSPTQTDTSLHMLRMKDLLNIIKQENPEIKKGALVLFGAFEQTRIKFRQESSFYYLTGITEPGVVAVVDLEGKSTLYVPDHGTTRAAWTHTPVPLTQENAKKLGFDAIVPLGQLVPGYQMYPLHEQKYYQKLLDEIADRVAAGQTIFTLNPNNAHEYVEQRFLLMRFDSFIPGLLKACTDISEYVALLRRKKDMREIEQLYKAVEITILAHDAAAQTIADGITESEVQASLEYMFTASGAQPSFPSIVATGKNATILHYTSNNHVLKDGQLVVVDIGAELDYYCADLTRTYPVSGVFTKRQKELYNLVLATQEFIAECAKPGMWLSNKEKPEKSLNHLAKKFLDERGYGKYFIHGIGHFLGIDVHDVGSHQEPLQEGDVFTIEPGIYIPEENIGIRIEDNYWMVKDGVVCLSEALPKKAEDLEARMQGRETEEELHDMNELPDEGDDDFEFAQS